MAADDGYAARISEVETQAEALAENQARITDYVTRRLFMIEELLGDIRRVITPVPAPPPPPAHGMTATDVRDELI